MAARLSRRTLLAAAGTGLAAWACSTPPEHLRPLQLEPGARVRDVRWFDGTWWACGSVMGADGGHSPRLWRGRSPDALHPVTLEPISFYGRQSELYSMGVGALGLVALGAQTGGFHAMPRSASWRLEGDVLREQDANFELFGGPRSLALVQGCAGPRFVLIGTRVDRRTDLAGGCAWSSPDGSGFVLHDDAPGLRAEAGEQAVASGVAARPDGSFVAVGDRFATAGSDATTHAAAWWTSDPTAWTRATVPFDARRGRTSMTAVAAGPTELLAGGTRTRDGLTVLCVWSSAEADEWQVQPIEAMSTTVTNTVSAVTALAHDGAAWWLGGRLGTSPVLARSTDARTWYRRPLPPGSPASAQVRVALAAREGQLLVGVADLSDAVTLRGPR